MTKQKKDVSNRFNRNPVAIYTKTLDLGNRKRKHSLRLIWNAINYLVKSGCQWRMLPSDFPKWQLVYYYY
nr:transposase [uncultured Flavobacterium sp.]